jgi:hypothetical protein
MDESDRFEGVYSLLKGRKPQTCDVWKVIIIFFEFETKWYLTGTYLKRFVFTVMIKYM